MHLQRKDIVAGIMAGQYPASELPMTPDESVIWRTHEVTDFGGKVLTPNQVSLSALTRLIHYANGSLTTRLRPGPRGGDGKVNFAGGLVVKTFFRKTSVWKSGLPALRANIALHTGLKRVEHPTGWHVSAPSILGAFMPEEDDGRPTWVMERANGRHPRFDINQSIVNDNGQPVLDKGIRSMTYTSAVEACGLRGRDIHLDDIEDNMFVTHAADTLPSRLVKFDVRATPPIGHLFVNRPEVATNLTAR